MKKPNQTCLSFRVHRLRSPPFPNRHSVQEEQRYQGRGTKRVSPAPPGKHDHFERRRPEESTLYQLVQEHLETFLAQVDLETGAGLPDFIKKEFDAFLKCGILASRLSAPALRRLRP